MNGANCCGLLRWCSPLTLVGRLHHIFLKPRIRLVVQIGLGQYTPSPLPRTISLDSLTKSKLTSQTFLIAPSTEKLAFSLRTILRQKRRWESSRKSNGPYASPRIHVVASYSLPKYRHGCRNAVGSPALDHSYGSPHSRRVKDLLISRNWHGKCHTH